MELTSTWIDCQAMRSLTYIQLPVGIVNVCWHAMSVALLQMLHCQCKACAFEV